MKHRDRDQERHQQLQDIDIDTSDLPNQAKQAAADETKTGAGTETGPGQKVTDERPSEVAKVGNAASTV